MDRPLVEDIVQNAGGAALLVFSLAAAVSVLRSPIHQAGAKILWIVFVLSIPLAGAVLWFFLGRAMPQERDAER